jgi:hypothetical protein
MGARGVIRRGFSTASDPVTAVREFSEAIAQPDIGLIVFFCSFAFDLDLLEPPPIQRPAARYQRRWFDRSRPAGLPSRGRH